MRESKLWFWHLVAGAVILVLLTIHMAIMHLDAIFGILGISDGDPIAFESVVSRSQQVMFMITYILLLGAALYHGFYGTRTILFELTLSRSLEQLINVVFVLAGVALFVFGSYAAIAAYLKL